MTKIENEVFDEGVMGFKAYAANGKELHSTEPKMRKVGLETITFPGKVAKFDFTTNNNDGMVSEFRVFENGKRIEKNFECEGCVDYGQKILGNLHVDGDSADEIDAANCKGKCSFIRGIH